VYINVYQIFDRDFLKWFGGGGSFVLFLYSLTLVTEFASIRGLLFCLVLVEDWHFCSSDTVWLHAVQKRVNVLCGTKAESLDT